MEKPQPGHHLCFVRGHAILAVFEQLDTTDVPVQVALGILRQVEGQDGRLRQERPHIDVRIRRQQLQDKTKRLGQALIAVEGIEEQGVVAKGRLETERTINLRGRHVVVSRAVIRYPQVSGRSPYRIESR